MSRRENYPGIGYPLQALKAQHGNLDDFAFISKPYRLSELSRTIRATA
jgi:hypothetical protein